MGIVGGLPALGVCLKIQPAMFQWFDLIGIGSDCLPKRDNRLDTSTQSNLQRLFILVTILAKHTHSNHK